MKIDGQNYQTIWLHPEDARKVCVIDQRCLPHEFKTVELATVDDMFHAIADMIVRGAPLIGVTAAYGMYLAALAAPSDHGFASYLKEASRHLQSSRPTAVNLVWALEEQMKLVEGLGTPAEKTQALLTNAQKMKQDDAEMCRRIGEFGVELIAAISDKKGGDTVNVLTHCNAGWLACVDWGTATSAIYQAFNQGIKVHVWVDETRPRNQGASLTAWELGKHGVPYTLITDNAGGHLMQQGSVDICFVGTDRTTRGGDVCNKIGTYLKALAARDNGIPFYVCAPSSSIDWSIESGRDIPIEERSADEVKYMAGLHEGKTVKVLIAPESANVVNHGFDVTRRELVTGLITERGIAEASEEGLCKLFPEKKGVTVS